MARVTVEDCVDKVDSPYELVLVAKERAAQLSSGVEPTLDKDNDKNTVIALREIAEKKIDLNEILKIKKHCSKRNLRFYISNYFKLALKLNLDGAYLPSFNKSFEKEWLDYKKINIGTKIVRCYDKL